MTIYEALQKYFGYKSFRPMQEDIIQNILNYNDTLVLMPTGGGKSICYQIPAIVSKGTCIVVSPLIALMQDQVQALQTNGVEAAFMNSSQTDKEQEEVKQQMLLGKLKLLYVSPEKLLTQGFMELIDRSEVSFFAIDEAHCVSQWGHDFRPEYSQLKFLREKFPQKTMVALTATADKVTRQDIVKQLALQQPQQFVASFNRKNLGINVTAGTDRVKKIIAYLKANPKSSGIIYCLSRKATEGLCNKIAEEGFMAGFYHAGMSSDERAKVQNAFLKDDIQIICATIAFGMGIDKSNVRFVIHYNLPKNIEGYYQEIGRAGRDGLPSDTILFYSYRDVQVLQGFIDNIDNEDFRELQAAKLDRMKQYAEAQTCRRKILLSYFSEVLEKDCGNCDVCKNPRKHFDGTILAQKALSAAVRAKEEVGINLLIDILRGSKNKKIYDNNYHQLKTYGVGSDVSAFEWKHYIQQMVNMGVLEIAYDKNYAIQRGVLAEAVLYENKEVKLVKAEKFNFKESKGITLKEPTLGEELFDRLRKLRKRIADENGIAPYLVFNDATLTEMAQERPSNRSDMLLVSGVGQRKMDLFGDDFLEVIQQFLTEKTKAGRKVAGGTHQVTYEMLQNGLSFSEIAQKRNMSANTIQGHFIALYEKGFQLNLSEHIHIEEVKTLTNYWKQNPQSTMKECFEHFQERYDYFKIRLSQMIWLKKQ